MNLVADANIIFSVLIVKGKTDDVFFSENLNLFVPEFLFQELEKYKDIILEKTYRNINDYYKALDIIKNKVTIIPNEEIEKYMLEAEKICPDKKDVNYFALALKLKCPLWSNDKLLKEQSEIKIYSTEDLIEEFDF